jgi:hypothetical protein
VILLDAFQSLNILHLVEKACIKQGKENDEQDTRTRRKSRDELNDYVQSKAAPTSGRMGLS